MIIIIIMWERCGQSVLVPGWCEYFVVTSSSSSWETIINFCAVGVEISPASGGQLSSNIFRHTNHWPAVSPFSLYILNNNVCNNSNNRLSWQQYNHSVDEKFRKRKKGEMCLMKATILYLTGQSSLLLAGILWRTLI